VNSSKLGCSRGSHHLCRIYSGAGTCLPNKLVEVIRFHNGAPPITQDSKGVVYTASVINRNLYLNHKRILSEKYSYLPKSICNDNIFGGSNDGIKKRCKGYPWLCGELLEAYLPCCDSLLICQDVIFGHYRGRYSSDPLVRACTRPRIAVFNISLLCFEATTSVPISVPLFVKN
jgi:hypothetical protein